MTKLHAHTSRLANLAYQASCEGDRQTAKAAKRRLAKIRRKHETDCRIACDYGLAKGSYGGVFGDAR